MSQLMVPRVQMSKDVTAVNGISDDGARPSTSTGNFGDAGYVRRISAVVGIEPEELSDKAIQDINSNVSYVLRSVIAGSLRFANHSRRTRILPEDVDAHLALERKPVLYGFKPRDLIALRLAGSGGRDVFVEEDKEIELAPIYTASAPKIPPIPSIRPHWLAIDGEQPAVPENPVPFKRESKEGSTEAITREDEVQEETNRLLNIIRGPKTTESVNVKTTTTHSLSLEQQVYYKEITEAIMGNDDRKRTEALHSLRTDSGIQSLVGRFSVAVAEGVRCNIVQHNLAFLIYLMRLVQSLVQNPALSVDKWLHEFLPSILSCILSRQVCTRPETDNHWALREFAGRLLVEVCRKHQGTDIQSRVIKVLTKAWLDPNASMSTIYGSIYTMDHFGPETVRSVVLPMIPSLFEMVEIALTDRSDHGERMAADRLHSYTTKMLVTHIRTMRPVNLTSYQDYIDVLGGFGDGVYRVVSGDVPVARTVPVPRGPPRPVQRATPAFVTQPRGTAPGRMLTNGNHQARYGTPTVVRRPPSNASSSSRPGPM